MLSLTNEVEAKYMNRTIEKLFESTFFVDSVGWQTAEKRVNIKNTHLLRCWKSIIPKFTVLSDIICNLRFQKALKSHLDQTTIIRGSWATFGGTKAPRELQRNLRRRRKQNNLQRSGKMRRKIIEFLV